MTVHAPIQADFCYDAPHKDGVGLATTVSIFADSGHLRETLREDVLAAGVNVREAASLAVLIEGAARPLGDVVMVDCPEVDGAALAALSRLDLRAAKSGARLIVTTSLDSLDDVFACMDTSDPLLLVNPRRSDRLVALGQVLARRGPARLRELSEEDRLMLIRLTEQVSKIAERVDRSSSGAGEGSAFRFAAPSHEFNPGDDQGERLVRASRPSLPDPRLVRRILRQRQLRARFFDAELFADPAWDMLLDLTAARAEHTRVSVTSLCIASGVPPTTALRWISQMTEAGLFERIEDESDRRRAFIALTEKAAEAMARYFAELGRNASRLV
ncbi:MAG: winged helix DNA-binding protein [Novosphingobium sp.]|nr:winged helix DNA-binding protein [Novosphingobium sp.]